MKHTTNPTEHMSGARYRAATAIGTHTACSATASSSPELRGSAGLSVIVRGAGHPEDPRNPRKILGEHGEPKESTDKTLHPQPPKTIITSKKDSLKTKILKKNQTLIVKPYIIHRMEAISKSIYLEASTSHLKDVVRLSDDYGRKKFREKKI